MYLATANPRDWIVDEVPDGYQFDPIRPARYAEIKMFCKIPRIIMVSATIRPKTLYMLGFSKERFDFYEYPSDFDPSRCPTYHIPTMRNDHRAQDYSMLYLRSDQIMGQRGDRKGIIHTVSWARRDEILARSKYGDRYVVNNKGESATAAIDAFRACGPPAVLVSPSVSTGVDFPYTDCEYQILLKIPFQDGRSKIVKARQDDDPDYGPYQAMQQLVQTVGRAMRAKDDRAEAYILDDHISWFRGKFGHFAPKTFHQFFREVNIVPPPPPKLIPLAAQTKEKL
jgi:Rad3-related DNA helicase